MIGVPKVFYWLPTLFWMVVVFGFSAQPSLHASSVGWQDFIIKKSAHVTEYFVLTCLLYYSFSHTTKLPRTRIIILALLLAFVYACTDEFHQLFVAGREGRVRDVLIDSLGIIGSGKLLTFLPKEPRVEIK
jgi:VanZ family protein